MARLRIGTASWTDPGFVADWYPRGLPATQRLRWYAQQFNYVEVNATFYALPAARAVERWCQQTPADFLFDIKLPKLLSRHSMAAKFLPPALRSQVPLNPRGIVQLTPDSERLLLQQLLQELQPMIEAKKLGAFLLQLSPAFSPQTHPLTALDSLRDRLGQHRLAVELRHRDWVSAEQWPQTIDYFRSRQITLVSVDAPASEHFTVMPGFDCVTNRRLGYVRLHGRNEQGYISGRSVAERFDYDYSIEEVKQIVERLRKLEAEVEELHIAANNNRSNYAPKLALRLRQALELREQLRANLGQETKLITPDLFEPS